MLRIKQLEDFGPISSLESPLELNDLTIFMGDNSAGKSYLAMLIAALFSMEKGYRDGDFVKAVQGKFKETSLLMEITKIADKISVIEANDEISLAIENDVLDILEEISKYAMNYLAKRYLVQKIFNNSISVKTLQIEIQKFNKKLFYDLNINCIQNDDIKTLTVSIGKYLTSYRIQGKFDPSLISLKIQEVILTALLHSTIKSSLLSSGIYLPASRTGYLQTYKVLANKAIESVYANVSQNNEVTNKLNIFITQFIQQLNSNVQIQKRNDIAKYIEDKILQGNVTLSKDTSDIGFKLASGEEIDINFLSSTASELIPLVVFLKRGFIDKDTLCVIEEPEAHLSFKNQRLMATIIAMLVKKGVKVLITTHSDFLIYELNNLIMKSTIVKNKDLLTENKDKLDEIQKEFFSNIENESIFLESKKVSLYNFEVQKSRKSIVKKIKIDKYGISNKYIFENAYAVTQEKNNLLDLLDILDACNK